MTNPTALVSLVEFTAPLWIVAAAVTLALPLKLTVQDMSPVWLIDLAVVRVAADPVVF